MLSCLAIRSLASSFDKDLPAFLFSGDDGAEETGLVALSLFLGFQAGEAPGVETPESEEETLVGAGESVPPRLGVSLSPRP